MSHQNLIKTDVLYKCVYVILIPMTICYINTSDDSFVAN